MSSTYKIKYFKNTKKIDNTIWLDKLINQLEKKDGGTVDWNYLLSRMDQYLVVDSRSKYEGQLAPFFRSTVNGI